MTITHARPQDLLGGFGSFESMPIAGTWRPGRSSHTLTDQDPWSGATLTQITQASAADVQLAYEAAITAQHDWAARLPAERAEVMLRAAQILTERHAEITAWVVAESGGTVGKVEVELAVARTIFLEAAGLVHHMEGRILPSDIPGKENRVYRRPVGVVCLISPWDFPVYLTSRSLAPALALGNAVVLKPSSQTPVTGGLLLARILREAGLPEGVLSVVVGSSTEIGDVLVAHPAPRVSSFTGSTQTGLAISRTAGLKRLLLELGGNAPMVVLDDADLEYAVESAVFGSFFNSGQICMIANRVIVDAAAHDAFVDAFVQRVRDLRVGDPSDPRTFIGPVISGEQCAQCRKRSAAP
jgi:aldehyde dehydrogenase (NAD+)